MIRIGRYDMFDKWDIVCRSWSGDGPTIDTGTDRDGRPSLPQWLSEALPAGSRACQDYIRLRWEAIDGGVAAAEPGDDGELNQEISGLLRELGYVEFRARSLRLIDGIKSSGFAVSSAELPPRISDRLKAAFKLGALLALRWTDEPGEIPDIEVLRFYRKPFPRAAIKRKRDVLNMFCARFCGVLDTIHLYDAHPDHVTLVDFDAASLEIMQRIYPRDWTYVCSDYKDFLRQAAERDQEYDLIVADPWRGQCPEVGFDMLPTIMGRCSGVYVAHYVKEMFNELGVRPIDRIFIHREYIAPDNLVRLSRAIGQRTGVDVVVTETVARSTENCWLVMRKQA